VNSIQYLYDSLTTTITHSTHAFKQYTLTIKNLFSFLELNLFIKPNTFNRNYFLSFREWKNFATIAIIHYKLKLDTI
jgi:hypothetical protein